MGKLRAMSKVAYIVSLLILMTYCKYNDKKNNRSENNLTKADEIVKNYKLDIRVDTSEDINTIEPKDLNVSGIKLGESIDVLLNKFGKPDSIRFEKDQDTNDSFTILYLKKSFFYISNKTISDFDISDGDFKLFNFLPIGENMEIVSNLFPLSFKNRTLEENSKTIEVDIVIKGTDNFLSIRIKDGKIINFHVFKVSTL